ncbi:MAG: glycogen/starch synthase [Bacteroidia bacterium]
MTNKKKILFVTHEMEPYAKITPYAKVARALPQKMQEDGMEVRVFMPKYGKINERRHRLHEVIRLSGINIPVGEADNPMIIKVASLPSAKMQVYFLDNEDYFHRKSFLGDDDQSFFEDNDERMIFFNKGVMEIMKKLGWSPDVIHCQGWMTALVPFYAKTHFKNEPVFKNAKFIFSVLDEGFNTKLGDGFAQKAGLNGEMKDFDVMLQNPECKDLYMAGIKSADAITTLAEKLDPEVEAYLNATDKPVLRSTDMESDELMDSYSKFYEELFDE